MKRKRSNHTKSAPMRIWIGASVGCVFSLCVAMLLTTLTINGTMREDTASFLITLEHGIATFLCTLISGKISSERRLLVCALSALLYCALLIGTTILVFDAQFVGVGGALLSCGLGAICGWGIGTLKIGKKTRRFSKGL